MFLADEHDRYVASKRKTNEQGIEWKTESRFV